MLGAQVDRALQQSLGSAEVAAEQRELAADFSTADGQCRVDALVDCRRQQGHLVLRRAEITAFEQRCRNRDLQDGSGPPGQVWRGRTREREAAPEGRERLAVRAERGEQGAESEIEL